MKPKILTIVGARPQFVKHAPMEVALNLFFEVVTIHTGQHFDENMSQIFFDELKIAKPTYLLEGEMPSKHGAQTGFMLKEIEEILLKEIPAAVLVYGDTNSTLSGALAAAKLNIPLVHIESGLRSFNREMPEEINRIITDQVSKFLFVPTQKALENLAHEGIVDGVYFSGDIMYDTLQLVRPYLNRLNDKAYFFVTLHRPYNTDDQQRMLYILKNLDDLPLNIIFPLHPRTKNRLKEWGILLDHYKNISFIDPVGYIDCLSYQLYSEGVITDSGGIQKEAYMLHKKCITIRKETEWVETLDGGCNTLLFDNLENMSNILTNSGGLNFKDLYGDGKAAFQIAEIISKHIH